LVISLENERNYLDKEQDSNFYTLDPTQKPINTLTKINIWAKSKNSHMQIK